MLATCPECGSSISSEATRCPRCGLPEAGARSREWVEHLARGFEGQGEYSVPFEFTWPLNYHVRHVGHCLFNLVFETLSVGTAVVQQLPGGPGYRVEIHLCCPRCHARADGPVVFDPVKGFIR